MLRGDVDAVRGHLVVVGLGLRNRHEPLRVAVHHREPAALDVDHHLVAAFERVRHVLHVECHLRDLARREGLRVGEAVAELAAHHLAPDELLEAAHGVVAVLVRQLARRVGGVHVDQLDDQVGVGAGGFEEQRGEQVARECEVFRQLVGCEHQHVGAVAEKRWSSIR